MEKTYNLDFKGYRLEGSEATLEEASGIYCVYACRYNKERDTVSLRDALYIGKAENIRTRMMAHKQANDFKEHLDDGEILCYSRASLDKDDLVRCESAMIYHHDFVGNKQATKAFHHDKTHVTTRGRNYALASDFIVERTAD